MACWAKEIFGLVTLGKHVRWDVPVECMMAFSRLVSSRGREDTPAHQRCLVGATLMSLIARLVGSSAATPEKVA